MATKIGEDTQVQLDLKTIGMIVGGVIALASMWFTLQGDIKDLQNQVAPEEFVKQFNSAVAEQIVTLTNDLVNQEMAFLSQTNQDPLVALKQRELDLKAQDIARKAQETAARLNVETNKFESQQDIAEDKLSLQEEVQRGRLKLQQEKAREEKS